MARPPRIDIAGGRYHVFNRGANRQTIFLNDADRVEFGRLLAEACEMFGVRVLAYCLMGNHYHLILHCPEAGLSVAMHRLASIFSSHFNERHGRDGPLFRGRFASIVIQDDAYLLTAFRYVHRNALDIQGVDEPESYRWSSLRAYLGLRSEPNFLATDEMMPYFDHERERLYRFVASDAPQRLRPVTSLEIGSLVELAVAEASIGDTAFEPRPQLGRVIAATMLDRLPAPTADALFEQLGRPSERTLRRAAQRRRQDPLVAELAARVEIQFGHAA